MPLSPLSLVRRLSGWREAAGSLLTAQRSPLFWSATDGRITLHTLIVIRWIAVVGQTSTVFFVSVVLNLPVPVGPLVAAIGASVMLNLIATAQRGGRMRLNDNDAALYLGYDTLQLSLLLYLTGGLANPFAILLLAPMTVGAAILSRRSAIMLTGLNLVCQTVLALWRLPLPWPAFPAVNDPLYAFGVWVSLSVSALFISGYVFRVAEEARRYADALTASQVALAREQRLSSLGALAAAAAHELGTPLGTIALVAGEMADEIDEDDPRAEDVALLVSQVKRCRDILADLARKPEADGGDPFELMPISALVEAAAAPHRLGHVTFTVESAGDGAEPTVRRLPEILHGVGNFIQNAHQFASRAVTVAVSWGGERIEVKVTDDGPGFPPALLNRIGEPYVSMRRDRSGHMGLGIFIAQTLLEKTGASVQFSNNRSGGARIIVRWPLSSLETRK
jgi:two-component system, sensor histidine kinase RegB